MGCFPYVEWLARKYERDGEKSECWWDYLKAHGLANYCVVIDPTEERYKLVYDIEESWYKGKHPLTYIEQRELTTKHKRMLEAYRDDVKDDFDSIERDEKQLSVHHIFSERNMEVLLEFSQNVFRISKACSEGFVSVAQKILSSCVDVLATSGVLAPCGFSVIALGSVAKGEATPYSDLEYAFIVESNDNYFEGLAVDSYFRIGNLCESPLGTFDITELKDDELPLPDIPTVGYRIDGIKKKAGNIPTGRPGGEQLILTVDSFMELYKREAEKQFDGIAGDKSDMLSSSVIIYGSGGHRCPLHDKLRQAITHFEVSRSTTDLIVSRKRLQSFAYDIDNYNYLLDEVGYWAANSVIQVKMHIFRYSTLLANNMRVCLALPSLHSWETFRYMNSSGLLSDEHHCYLQIVLALAIYLRTKSYISLKTQTESVSLYTSTITLDKQLYHIPQNIFVILGCLLIPIKRSIKFKLRHCFHLVYSSGDIKSLVPMLMQAIHVNKEDFMVKVTLLLFIADDIGALEELNKGVGGNIESFGCVQFIDVLREKCSALIYSKNRSLNSKIVECKYLIVCCSVLERNEKCICAVEFFSGLQKYLTSPIDRAQCKVRTANCMIKLQNFKAAENLFYQALNSLREALGLNAHQDFLQSLQNKLKLGRFFNETVSVFTIVAYAHKGLGECFWNYHSYKLDQSLQVLTIATSIFSMLLQVMLDSHVAALPVIKFDSVGQYLQLIDVKRCSPSVRFCFHLLAETYNTLYRVHLDTHKLSAALKYATKSLNILLYLIGTNTNYRSIATSYVNLAIVYGHMKDYSTAFWYNLKALHMYKELSRDNTVNFEIANLYLTMAKMNTEIGDYSTALHYGTKSLEIHTAILGSDSTHIDQAHSNDILGDIHTAMGNYEIALDYYLKALSIMETLLGVSTNHPKTANIYAHIAMLYRTLGQSAASLEYYIRSIEMRQALPVTKENSYNIVSVYHSLADIYMDTSNTTCYHNYAYICYTNALMISVNADYVPATCTILCILSDLLIKRSSNSLALKFVQKASQKLLLDSKLRPHILKAIGGCYTNLGSWKEAWSFLYLALQCHQPVPDSRPGELAEIHISISHLLLHLGHVSQALEHSQQALDITDTLLSTQKYPIPQYIKLNKKAQTLVDSIHLIKCFQYQFSEFRYLS